MKENRANPLLAASPLPFGAPAFDQIQKSDYLPAFRQAIDRARAQIRAITDNPEAPSFANPIEALERSGEDLDRIAGIFFNLTEACTDDEMDGIAEEVSPLLTQHNMSVLLDEKLFARVKAVWQQRGDLQLDTEAAKLLDLYVEAKDHCQKVEAQALKRYKQVLPTEKVAKLLLAEEKFRHRQIGQLQQGRPQGNRPGQNRQPGRGLRHTNQD